MISCGHRLLSNNTPFAVHIRHIYIRLVLVKLLLLFTVVPVIELALLIQAGNSFGVLPTVGIVLATGISGAWLARSQGMLALRRLQRELATAAFPAEEIFDGFIILVGGILLLTPGFMTDIIGLAALVPGSRHLIKLFLKREVRRRLGRRVSVPTHTQYRA